MTQHDTHISRPVLTLSQALEFIADAGVLLSSSLDYADTLRQVAGLAVPAVADWCGLFILDDDDTEFEITSGHADPELDTVLREIRRRRRDRHGLSESRRVAHSGEPILAHDIRATFSDGLDERERELVTRLAPKSYMLVPLQARGRSLGSLTLLSTTEGRHYTEQDLAFATTLAARCATAIDNARLHLVAERSLRLLDTIFATAPVGMAFVDPELRFVRINETLATFTRRPVQAHLGHTMSEVLGDGGEGLVVLFRRVLDTGEPILDVDFSGRPDGGGPELRHWTISCVPVHGADGAMLGVNAVVMDVTERRRLLEAEREARVRADFLARAGSLLDESLDYEQTLRAVAEIAIPDVADWCGVSILAEDGTLREVAAADHGAEQRARGDELHRRIREAPEAMRLPMRVARTGATEFVPEITEARIETISDPEHRNLVRRLGLRSSIVAPLLARGRILGTLTLATSQSGRRFDEADVQLAEELARRAGIAIDNARLYTERTHIAHTLQVKLLPERLPDIPGVMLAARYRAAGELNEVGGDFYDVFPRSSEEWAMVVGDVSGKGAEAAAITALARYTLRAGALDDDQPGHALRRLNTAMMTQEDTSQFTTAVLAYVSAVRDDRLRVRLSLAGHPPPLVLRRDGSVLGVGTFGTMLGLRTDPAMYDSEIVLDRGDVLLLYTDGVTESGPRSSPLGGEGLAALLRTLTGSNPQTVVDAVEQAVVDAEDERPRDDIALLAVALRDESGQRSVAGP